MAEQTRKGRKGGFIVLGEVDMVRGFKMLELPKKQRIFQGKHIAEPGGAALFKSVYEKKGKITCFQCGWKATHFSIERHKNDQLFGWVMNLVGKEQDNTYMMRSNLDRDRIIRMLTQDHIVPVSLGGTDSLDNLRCMCEKCNVKRGNAAPIKELLLSLTHPHTYDGLRAKVYKKFKNAPLDELVLMAENFHEEVPT